MMQIPVKEILCPDVVVCKDNDLSASWEASLVLIMI